MSCGPVITARSVSSSLVAAAFLWGCGAEAPPDAVRTRVVPRPRFASSTPKKLVTAPNASGDAATLSVSGDDISKGLFFANLGNNGRSCGSCHAASDGWTINPASLQKRFDATDGTDPLFRTNDGSNSPSANVSTVAARRAAYSMLLTKGLIRVGIGIPPNAEFELAAVDDPYGFASATQLSLFRRPLPTTNLTFLSGVMWDGRETFEGQTLHFDLAHQANDATTGHAEGPPLTAEQQDAIEQFEIALFTAQVRDNLVGNLDARKALGGPTALSLVQFSIGVNDPLGPPGGFNPVAMTLFAPWATADDTETDGPGAAQASIVRGQRLFNTKPISIDRVRGLNPNGPAIAGTCTTCHNSPNVGNHSVSLPLDLGLTDASHRTPDMPLYTLRNRTTGELFQTTDPGRAMITGRWADRGRFKGPILRALAARGPYFHNGSAATLDAVLDFYVARFGMTFTAGERRDLIAFLKTL